jgi:lipoyl(octanoyl) transferase
VRIEVITAGAPVDYQQAWDQQRSWHAEVVEDARSDLLWLLEHPSVYTAGKRTEPLDRPRDGTPVIDVDRGGRITWHGSGQLVGYPIVRLPDPIDVVAHVRRIESLLIDVCSELGVTAGRVEGRSGVWVPADDRGTTRKVAAIGVRVSRGVTMHGFALNCDPDLVRPNRPLRDPRRHRHVAVVRAGSRRHCRRGPGAGDRAGGTGAHPLISPAPTAPGA